MPELIFKLGKKGLSGSYIPECDLPAKLPDESVPKELLRESLPVSSIGELEVVRHYTNLSRQNFCVDSHFYPLGSCTMKYNPKINEVVAGLAGFTGIHPCQDGSSVQGALELIYNLQEALCAITGMKRLSLQASSGAQGELTGMLMISKYHKTRGNKKSKVIVPDSSHGTNPASAAMAGYEIVVVESGKDGLIDMDKLSAALDDKTAAIMLTNPNTLGLFEEDILKISQMAHAKDCLLYYDGANFNALCGIACPGLMGFDVIHLNLHKTFSTPHGCGGPGAAAIGAGERLCDYLPVPLVKKNGNKFSFDYKLKHSIGCVRGFYGNFTVLVRAYAYILRLGSRGLARVSQNATLNANYVKAKLQDLYEPASKKQSMHEVVFSCLRQSNRGVHALDIAKRLIDEGVHPPTMYFPLIVKEALMIEPTETENKETLDNFIGIMRRIDSDSINNPGNFLKCPATTSISRPDEVKASRQPDIRYNLSGPVF